MSALAGRGRGLPALAEVVCPRLQRGKRGAFGMRAVGAEGSFPGMAAGLVHASGGTITGVAGAPPCSRTRGSGRRRGNVDVAGRLAVTGDVRKVAKVAEEKRPRLLIPALLCPPEAGREKASHALREILRAVGKASFRAFSDANGRRNGERGKSESARMGIFFVL